MSSCVVLALLAGCTGATDAATTQSSMAAVGASQVPDSLGPAAAGREEDLSSTALSPVYWIGEVDGEQRLYREFARPEDFGDPVVTALQYLLNGKPFDPNYVSLLNPSKIVGATIDAKNVITVDVAESVFSRKLEGTDRSLAVQQMVYTATAAAAAAGLLVKGPEPSVRILSNGRSGTLLYGSVSTEAPLHRDPALRAPVWIIEPQFSSTRTPGEVQITGVANDYPGGLRWSLERIGASGVDGTEALLSEPEHIGEGAMIQGAGELPEDEFEQSVMLSPGLYQVEVWGVGPNGEALGRDRKVFSVLDPQG